MSSSTTNPDQQWYVGVVADFTGSVPKGMPKPRLVARDRDSKYGAGFDDALAGHGIEAVQLPFRSPNLNAHVERLIQSVRKECLDHFIVMGTGHMDYLLAEYIDYHNRQRPHSSLDFATAGWHRDRATEIGFAISVCLRADAWRSSKPDLGGTHHCDFVAWRSRFDISSQ